MKLQHSPRIAIVAASAPPYSSGGVASAHYNLFRALKDKGFTVNLFTFFDNGISDNQQSQIIRRGASPWLVKGIYWFAQLPFRIIQPGKLAYQSAVIFRSSIGAIKMGRAIARFDPDLVVLSDHGAPGLFVKKRKGQRFFLISHHNPARFAQEPLLGDYSKLDARLAVRLEDIVLRKVDQVICPSRYISKWFHSTYSFEGPVTVLPNLIDLDLIDSIEPTDIRREIHLPKEAILIYLPSAGTRIKGSGFLSEIVDGLFRKARKQIGLYIPGGIDDEIKTWLNSASRLGSIYSPSQLSYEDHIAIVKTCSFGISPAVMENFSMAILEATYCGVPMIAFRRGGNEDIIDNGENGYLLPAFDVRKLLKVASRLVENKQIDKFQKGTKNFTRKKFDSHLVLGRYLQVLGIEKSD
jgi:glycosyltransferase involved in cell wall biosynthesis